MQVLCQIILNKAWIFWEFIFLALVNVEILVVVSNENVSFDILHQGAPNMQSKAMLGDMGNKISVKFTCSLLLLT
jgi:hypothetical protein